MLFGKGFQAKLIPEGKCYFASFRVMCSQMRLKIMKIHEFICVSGKLHISCRKLKSSRSNKTMKHSQQGISKSPHNFRLFGKKKKLNWVDWVTEIISFTMTTFERRLEWIASLNCLAIFVYMQYSMSLFRDISYALYVPARQRGR